MSFFESHACQSRRHCGECRADTPAGRAFRRSVGGGDFECPHGVPWPKPVAATLTIGGAIRGAVGIAKAVVGIGLAPDDVIESRRATCGACERRDDGTCTVCGCLLEYKTRLASSSCPLDPPKWTAHPPNSSGDKER